MESSRRASSSSWIVQVTRMDKSSDSDFRPTRVEKTHTAATSSSSSDDDSDQPVRFNRTNPRGRRNETKNTVLSESSGSQKVSVIEISSDSEATSGFRGTREEEEETNHITCTAASSSSSSSGNNDSDHSIQFTHSTPRGRRNETEDEVQAVTEAKRTPETPPAPYSSFSQEDDIPSDDDSTDEEECMAYEHQDISGIASRIRPRGNKHHAVISESKSSDTDSIYYSFDCSFSESDDSDDPDYGSTSCIHSKIMGGINGKEHMSRSESVVERVDDKDTQEPKKKKPVVEVDHVVERVHDEDTRERKKKKPMVELDHVNVLGMAHEHRDTSGIATWTRSRENKHQAVERDRKPMREEREQLVRKCVVEQVHRKHRNGDVGVNSSHEMHESLSPFREEKEEVHKTDAGNRKGKEVMDETVENPAKRSNYDSPGEERDFRRLLLDSLLNESPVIVEEKSSKPDLKIPTKFRFDDDDDEILKPKEKTEYEIEAENMYDVMNNYFALEEAKSLYQPEVKEDAAESSDNGSTEDHRCCKVHDYLEDDATGMVCRICQHVGLKAKDVLLQWAEKPFRRVRKRKYPSDDDEHPREECIRFASGESSRTVFLNPGVGTVWDIQPGVKDSMYKHQREGFEFLWKNMAGSIDLAEIKSSCSEFGGCIISHAPGTGKTRLTMMFVETYLKLFPDCRPVIIAPSSMLLTWEGEFRKWNVGFPFYNLNNPEVSVKENELAQRLSNKKVPNSEDIRLAKICSWSKEQSVLGMSYKLFAELVGEKRPAKKSVKKKKLNPDFKRILLEKPGLVVLDEGHIPRNQTSSIWNALLKLRTEKRVVLSGTPYQNNFREIFNVMQVARPSFAISIEKDPRFADMISSNKKKLEAMEQKDMDKAILELKTAMAPYVNMYNDSSFLQSKLPGLRDFLLILKPTALQNRIIEEMERPNKTFKLEAKVALVSVHPSLFNPSEKEKLMFGEAKVKKSRPKPDEGVKTRFVMELVRISMARNDKVLVFSQYIKPLLLLRQHLCKGFNWGDSQVLMIKGKVDQKQRQKLMASFNNPNDEAKVLLASTRCCSEGVSLVGASRVVLLDVVWNPAVERQAISRAYRIGQTKIVYTYHLMASGTSEMDKYHKQAEKNRLSEMVFVASSAGTSKLNDTDERIEDVVLEKMIANEDFKQIFENITYQPKQ